MTQRFITDDELTIAAAMVSEAMLRSLPEPEECTGQFSSQFEEKIEKLKKTAVRKANWKKFARSAVAAVLVVLISFSLLFAFNTEVRATVVTWFKEIFGTYTTYWFSSSEEKTLPEYELTWVPDGYEIIIDELLPDSRTIVYQLGDNVTESFVFSYCLAKEDSASTIYTFDDGYIIEEVSINGCHGEFYESVNELESHALVWLDEYTNTVNTIISYLSKDQMIEIANNITIS